ncbi:MAG: aspartate aminotransferase family protein [Gammaproteobacteria bacterium]|nr:aspartate aminotransferase family protein [Gammaproteobacteria bacterium]MDE0258804.1 aspartate aminotransferase family protein [Gammaproteobacteria bacterium]
MSGGRPFGDALPHLRVTPPGPRSRALGKRLRQAESRNVTFIGDRFPVFWEEALGSNVRDVDGNVYVDLTGAFGVAFAGHRHPRIVRTAAEQQHRLTHGMGDIHPPAAKVELLERLTGLAPWPEARAVLASAGSEAVEIALKTAELSTGRAGILAFECGYHGLTLGALATTHRDDFRAPFRRRLYDGVVFAPFPGRPEEVSPSLAACERAFEDGARRGAAIGAVLVEPVQGRGGVGIPPRGFFPALCALARQHGAVVVADEVFTGLGRCGSMFAGPALGLDADLICLGKALGGGFPLSACLGTAEVFDAWPESAGEALHTSTFLGHPVACAASLAFLDLVESERLHRHAASLGEHLLAHLRERLDGVAHVREVRGLGLLAGIEIVRRAPASPGPAQAVPWEGAGARIAARLLAKGVMVLPAGEQGQVIELTPPATMSHELLDHALDRLVRAVIDLPE